MNRKILVQKICNYADFGRTEPNQNINNFGRTEPVLWFGIPVLYFWTEPNQTQSCSKLDYILSSFFFLFKTCSPKRNASKTRGMNIVAISLRQLIMLWFLNKQNTVF